MQEEDNQSLYSADIAIKGKVYSRFIEYIVGSKNLKDSNFLPIKKPSFNEDKQIKFKSLEDHRKKEAFLLIREA